MDIYPVTLHLPDGTRYPLCKARVDGGGVAVYQWDKEAAAAVLVFSSPNQATQDGPKKWSVDGTRLVKGCTCGGAGRNPIRNATLPGGNVAVAGA